MEKLVEIICLVFLFAKSAKCEGNETVHLLPQNIFQFSRTNAGVRYRLSLEQVTYNVARNACTLADSILAEPRTSGQGQFLYDVLIKSEIPLNQTSAPHGVWIGLKKNKTSIENEYWISDLTSLASTNYTNWAKDEPSTPGAFCIQLWRGRNWKWDDTYCDKKKFFICQDQDPASYTKQQANQLARSIIGTQNQTNVDQGTVSLLSSQLSTLLDVSSQNIHDVSSHDVLVAVETVTDHYDASQGDFEINRKNIGIEIKDLTRESEKEKNHGGAVLGESISNLSHTASEAYLSNSLLHEARQKYKLKRLQVGAVFYRKNSLFVEQPSHLVGRAFGEGPTRHVSSDVISHVLSLEVKNAEMKDLQSAVITRHKVHVVGRDESLGDVTNTSSDVTNTSSDVMQRRTTVKCVYWDLNHDMWSNVGCKIQARENVTDGYELITCSCNHMTPFAVILSIDEFYQPIYLNYLTIAGCSVSIACLLTTIFTYLYFKQLRSKLPQQVLIHLCCSLLFLNIAFLIGIQRIEFATFCFVITAILHYAVLLSWAWMLAEAVLLFRTLVLAKTGSGHENKFIWIASVLCYGVPAGLVAVLANTLDIADYKSERYCWISRIPLLYSVVIPVGLILFINLIIFAVIMYNITFRSKAFRQNIDLQRISMAVRRALCMIFVLGLPWIFGFIMLLTKDDDTKEIFSVLFTIFNAFQGLFIFILFCVRQESVRTAWTKPLGRKYRKTFKLFRTRNMGRKFTGSDGTTDNEGANQATGQMSSAAKRRATIDTNLSMPSMDEVQANQRPPPVPKKPLPPPPFEKPHPFRSGWN